MKSLLLIGTSYMPSTIRKRGGVVVEVTRLWVVAHDQWARVGKGVCGSRPQRISDFPPIDRL